MVSIIFVAGAARSGSTVFGATLGALPGFVNVGELSNLWSIALTRPGFRCGCDEAMSDCSFWASVEDTLRQRRHYVSPALAIAAQRKLRGARAALGVGPHNAQRTFIDTVVNTYHAVAEVTGAQVIVDTSKDPAFIGAACAHPRVDGSIVHLVRDPRGHVASQHHGWRGKRGTDHPLDYPAAARTVLAWTKANGMSEALRQRSGTSARRLRYEDFTESPADACQAVLELVDVDARLGHIRGTNVDVGVQHTSAGNPGRRGREQLQLTADNTWRSLLSRSEQAALFALGLPLTRVYGYRLTGK